MTHPYPPHRDYLPYTGKHSYFLTFSTDGRRRLFLEADDVTLVRMQFLRAAGEEHFEITAYCFMPDHLHVVVTGRRESCDAKRFIKRAKQYSGYYYKQAKGTQLSGRSDTRSARLWNSVMRQRRADVHLPPEGGSYGDGLGTVPPYT